MDSCGAFEEKKVIQELIQGLQMAQQLRINLGSAQARDFFIRKILSSYDNALLALKSGLSAQPQPRVLRAPSLPESPVSFGSEAFKFDQPFSGENIISKKRKGCTTWDDQVRICSHYGLEVDIDDGYNWRKYGQKDIIGTKFPRSYYRCSYRKAQKCFATRQVQRSDENPGVFEIAYKGEHTCNHSVQSASPPPPPSPEKHEITPTHHHHQLSPPSPDEILSNLRANLSVTTTNLGGDGDTSPSSFSFPSTSSGLMDDFHQIHFPNHFDDELFQVYSPPFISPVTSDWGSSQSLDFLGDPADVDLDFEFTNSLF